MAQEIALLSPTRRFCFSRCPARSQLRLKTLRPQCPAANHGQNGLQESTTAKRTTRTHLSLSRTTAPTTSAKNISSWTAHANLIAALIWAGRWTGRSGMVTKCGRTKARKSAALTWRTTSTCVASTTSIKTKRWSWRGGPMWVYGKKPSTIAKHTATA